MKAIKPLGSLLFLFTVLFANTAMAQDTFLWTGATNNNWATATNWSKSGTASADTFPGQTLGRKLDVVTISNGGTPTVAANANPYGMVRLIINNATGAVTGSTVIITPNATLDVGGASNNVQLNGGNLVNNGILNIATPAVGFASNGNFPAIGINCGNPTVMPSVATEYGYSGIGALSVTLSAANFANAAAFSVTGTSANPLCANVTYKLVLNNPTIALNQSSAATIGAIRTIAATSTNLFTPKLIISGTLNLGTAGTPSIGSLIAVGNGTTVTVDTNTTLTFNSASANLNNGIDLSNAFIGTPTNFTNNGTINILGESLRSGINAAVTSTVANQDIRINVVNGGNINVDLACITPSVTNPPGFSWSGQAAYRQAQSGFSGATGVVFTNNGTLTLKNRSTVALTGYAIWGSGAGQRMPTAFTNSSTGILNIEGSINSIPAGFTLTNFGTVNSNNSIAGFTGTFTNNVGASVNLGKTPAIFTVLGTAAATVGATYRDASFNVYTIRTTKVNGAVLQLLAETAPIAAIPASGVLTLLTGTGDATIDFTAVTGITATAISQTTFANSGTINTAQGGGFGLNIISSATLTLDANSIIAPGGSSGKGITDFARAANTLLGKVALQVSGDTTSGIDYDQIISTATNGGFDISGAILEITSLYTPSSSTVIPIVVASGAGTITGTFPSVTGLTAGWTVSYASLTSVNLVYTVIVIPTIWTGAANNDFFNEANWIDSVTSVVPAANTINPGTNINLHLQINSAVTSITSGLIQFGTGGLAISSANLTATSLSGGTVTVNEGGYVDLSSANPLLNNVQINFTSGIGWIRTPNYNASAISATNLGQIKVNNITAIYENNLRLDHYYLNGCVIRANLASTNPLTVYDSANLVGTPIGITVNTMHSGAAIANAMNNKVESFILKKGFMVTFANEIDGTGKSKNYIASEEDLVINTLPIALINSISFIRVMPWNWTTKKGRTDIGTDLNTSWVYKWNSTLNTTLDWEYAPMSWGNTGADDASDIALYAGKYNSTHIMSFNEPDDCDAQSGQYGNLCQTDVAVALHKNLMKTGMRLVSPGGREEAPFAWLKEFYDKAKVQDIRIDVIAVHWYDWGSNPAINTNPTGQQVFDRFKAYLTNVHNLYQLPIWITEFNANPARSQTINSDFMALALPYLESLDYIERYNWFPYNTGTDFYTDVANTLISDVGMTYRDQVSTPAISDANVVAYNNLQNVALDKTATANSTFTGSEAKDAVDGDTKTTTSQWVKNFGVSGGANYSLLPAWLEVDLLGRYTINGFRIIEQTNALKDFTFQVWNAATSTWNTVLTVTGNPATPLATFKTFTPVTTTKVRLNITAHNSTDFIRMFELEVYGEPNNPTWTGTTSSVWTVTNNWSTGILPDQYSNVAIPAGTPNQPSITSTTTINSLSIALGATLTVTAPNFTITSALANNGTTTLANSSNLIQGGSINANTGNITVNRNSNALKRLDYTMWSSPVANQNLSAFSPKTSTTRFYEYNETTNEYNTVNPSLTSFANGTGYLIRMPNTDPTVGYDAGAATLSYPGVFTGIPNNGTVKLTSLTSDRFYSIGNPYPSTISASSFLTGNSTGGTLYFWRKTNGVANSNSAYATRNSTGGTAAGNVTPNNIIPNGTIQVGQGFIVKTGLTATSLTFTNAMRLGTASTQFLKIKQAAEPDRLWLNLTSAAGAFSQTLVGYLDGATLGVDNGFDGEYINDSPVALTSNINNAEYTIQGRPAFDPSDVVALNFKTDVLGEYTIAIDHFEGVFATGQDVYLMDSKTGIETDLKAAAYNFAAAAGIDNARFSLKYQKTLKIDAPAFNENSVRVYKNNGNLYVNSGTVAVNNIKVFDIQGRLIAEQKNVKATTAAIKDLKATNQVLIVKITGEDTSVVSKKVVH